jgi:hypothetical protein
MCFVAVKCLIFTLIIDFYLFFDKVQSTGGKELTIAKVNISRLTKFYILSNFANSISNI